MISNDRKRWGMIAIPEYPPRVRAEWLIAGTRVVLAGGALLVLAIDPLESNGGTFITYLLAWYLLYSLAMLAMVWAPVRFGRGWDVAVHLCDIVVLSLLAGRSSFFAYFIFLLICATLRWQVQGTLWTAAATLAAYTGNTLYATQILHQPFELNTFLIRTIYLTVVTALLAYLGAHQYRSQSEISRIASWPRTLSRNALEVVSEILSQTGDLLDAPRVALVWNEPGEDWVNLAWQSDGTVVSARVPEGTYGLFVLHELEQHSFQASDVTRERGRVEVLTARGFQRRECRPVNEALRVRFGMHAVQSWPVASELICGRMFCLDKTRMRLDDLVFGQVVARLVVSRLETVYLLTRLHNAAALEERVRVARDLHDSVLQSQAGTALQLLAARRLLDRDPGAVRDRLENVQQQLERGELEMRSFIRSLRPTPPRGSGQTAASLRERLEELKQRIELRWEVRVDLRIDSAADRLLAVTGSEVYRLVQEAVVNAARHADASVIEVVLSANDDQLILDIVDDGHGFPFRGTYDLAALREMNQGPLTLKERVTELNGDLTLRSAATGTELVIRLPVAPS